MSLGQGIKQMPSGLKKTTSELKGTTRLPRELKAITSEPVFRHLFKTGPSPLMLSNRESEEKTGVNCWDIRESIPLKFYVSKVLIGDMGVKIEQLKPPRFDFNDYLEAKIMHAGSPVRVLDIGALTGRQWSEPLAKHGGKLEISLTTLADFPEIHPEMRKFMKFAAASELHEHFKPGYFDLIVSRGVIGQLDYAVAESIFLLREGGEAMFCGSKSDGKIFKDYAEDNSLYRVIAADPPDSNGLWFLHIQKK